MTAEYQGKVTSIDLPCPILLDVAYSIAVEEHLLDVMRTEGTYPSGNEVRFEVALFEKYLGDVDHSDVPIIKYSAKNYAPALCNSLRLRTPNYYRTLETDSPGLVDPLEGCRVSHRFEDGSELSMNSMRDDTSIVLDAGGAHRKDGCFKTFMYCASLFQGNRAITLEHARCIFGQDYTHGSVFQSSRQLARHILKSFAVTIGNSMLESAKPPEGQLMEASAAAWIVHGPVQYLKETNPMLQGIESLFSKTDHAIYRNQGEYRFWVGFSNTPVQSDEATISLPVPEHFATILELGC